MEKVNGKDYKRAPLPDVNAINTYSGVNVINSCFEVGDIDHEGCSIFGKIKFEQADMLWDAYKIAPLI